MGNHSTPQQAGEKRGKLDAAGKDQVCAVLAVGGSTKMAARVVGCSERAIYYAGQRDPDFRRRMEKNRECPALVCMTTLKEAASDKKTWRAADYYMRLVYPERMNRSPRMMPVENARKLLLEIGLAIDSIVKDEATRGELMAVFNQLAGIAPPQDTRRGLPAPCANKAYWRPCPARWKTRSPKSSESAA
jgi:hypothetical protein